MGDYDADVLAWAEQQGALLRRRAAGERVNDTGRTAAKVGLMMPVGTAFADATGLSQNELFT
jgi:hypothetical protein